MSTEELRKLEQYQSNNDVVIQNYFIDKYGAVYISKVVTKLLKTDNFTDYFYEELYSYGLLGFIDVLKRFNTKKYKVWNRYVYIKIKGFILDAVRVDSRSFLNRYSYKLKQKFLSLKVLLDRNPTIFEIKNHYKVSDKVAKRIFEIGGLAVYSSETNTYKKYVSKMVDKRVNMVESAFRKDVKQALLESIDKLNDRYKFVVIKHYFEEYSLHEISKMLKITHTRVVQIKLNSLKILKTDPKLYFLFKNCEV